MNARMKLYELAKTLKNVKINAGDCMIQFIGKDSHAEWIYEENKGLYTVNNKRYVVPLVEDFMHIVSRETF